MEEKVCTTGDDGDDDYIVIVDKPKSIWDDVTLIDVLFSPSKDNCIYPQKCKQSLKSKLFLIKGKTISKIVATDL